MPKLVLATWNVSGCILNSSTVPDFTYYIETLKQHPFDVLCIQNGLHWDIDHSFLFTLRRELSTHFGKFQSCYSVSVKSSKQDPSAQLTHGTLSAAMDIVGWYALPAIDGEETASDTQDSPEEAIVVEVGNLVIVNWHLPISLFATIVTTVQAVRSSCEALRRSC